MPTTEGGAVRCLDEEKLYAALFLDNASKRRLLAWWRQTVRIPVHKSLELDHMTIAYDPSPVVTAGVPVGLKASITVVGYAADEFGQAVLVHTPAVRSLNRHPHITIATAIGTGPVYSNTLLARGCVFVEGPSLSGVVDIRV